MADEGQVGRNISSFRCHMVRRPGVLRFRQGLVVD